MKKTNVIIFFLILFIKFSYSQPSNDGYRKLPEGFVKYFTKHFKCSSMKILEIPPLNKTMFGGIDTIKITFVVQHSSLFDLSFTYDVRNVFIEPCIKETIEKYNYDLVKDGKYKFNIYILVLNSTKKENINFNLCFFKDGDFWSISTKALLTGE
jgi:hypothetical protein